MMIPTVPFPLLSPLLLLIPLFLLFIQWKRDRKTQKRLPPGPWKLPLIGNLHQMIGGGRLPSRTITNLAKKYGPIMHLQLGQVSTIIISSKEIAEEAFTKHDLALANRPESLAAELVAYKDHGIAFAPYGNYWKQVRKITITHLLNMKRFHLYRSIGEEEVGKLIRSISSSPRGQAINFSSMVFVLINSMISRAAFGEVMEDQNEFLSLVREQMELGVYLLVPAIFPSLGFLQEFVGVKPAIKKMHQRMEKVLENIRKSHNIRKQLDDNSREEDFLDELLNLQATAGLGFSITNTTINAIILDIIVAATENPSVTIEWAMSELLRNPRVMKRAQEEVRGAFKSKGRMEDMDIQEMHYLKSVIKETLRLHPLLPFIPRESRQVCEIGGYELPLKTKVVINSWAICRDPNIWVEPDKFLPERFLDSSTSFHGTTNYEYTPFGAGKRMCLGRSFAMVSVEITLAHLLCHFDWKLPDGIAPRQVDMTEIFAVVCGRKNHLHIIPTPYIPNT